MTLGSRMVELKANAWLGIHDAHLVVEDESKLGLAARRRSFALGATG